MIRVGYRNDEMTFGIILMFDMRNGEGKILEKYVSHRELISLFEYHYNTAAEARCNNEQANKFIDNIVDYVYNGFNITEYFSPREELKDYIIHNLHRARKPKIHLFGQEEIKEFKPEIPEEIKDALELAELAKNHTKEIVKKTNEIETRKKMHIEKYGDLKEKSKAYLESFYNK